MTVSMGNGSTGMPRPPAQPCWPACVLVHACQPPEKRGSCQPMTAALSRPHQVPAVIACKLSKPAAVRPLLLQLTRRTVHKYEIARAASMGKKSFAKLSSSSSRWGQ